MCLRVSFNCGGTVNYGDDNWFSSTSLCTIIDVYSGGSLSNTDSSSMPSGGGGVVNF